MKINQSQINKKAWNYRTYEFWNMYNGTPKEYAAKLRSGLSGNINERYAGLFTEVKDKKILNALGSNGRKAVPLALLGAEVTIIDISAENRKYALELAKHAGVRIRYEVGDFINYENHELEKYFDIAFSEGGILHYFDDIHLFFAKINGYLKSGGMLIINDFHPIRKVLSPEIGTDGDYFETELHEGHVAYQDRFDEEEQKNFPQCQLRYYRMGEIVTAIGMNGFCIKEMREIKNRDREKVPAEFTIIAVKT